MTGAILSFENLHGHNYINVWVVDKSEYSVGDDGEWQEYGAYTYDHNGRLIKLVERITDVPIPTAKSVTEFKYDDQGRLKERHVRYSYEYIIGEQLDPEDQYSNTDTYHWDGNKCKVVSSDSNAYRKSRTNVYDKKGNYLESYDTDSGEKVAYSVYNNNNEEIAYYDKYGVGEFRKIEYKYNEKGDAVLEQGFREAQYKYDDYHNLIQLTIAPGVTPLLSTRYTYKKIRVDQDSWNPTEETNPTPGRISLARREQIMKNYHE